MREKGLGEGARVLMRGGGGGQSIAGGWDSPLGMSFLQVQQAHATVHINSAGVQYFDAVGSATVDMALPAGTSLRYHLNWEGGNRAEFGWARCYSRLSKENPHSAGTLVKPFGGWKLHNSHQSDPRVQTLSSPAFPGRYKDCGAH